MWLPQSPRGGIGYGSSASKVDVVVVVVVYVIIVVVTVPKFNIGCRLRETEGYLHVNHQPGIFVVFILSPLPERW